MSLAAATPITLDGDETTHACTRPSKRGDDLFGVIFQNAGGTLAAVLPGTRCIAFVACLLMACTSSDGAQPEFVLRVSTYYGLTPMHSFQRQSMTANLSELVYEPLSAYFGRLERHGTTVILSPLPATSPPSLPLLAASLEHPSHPTIRVVQDEVHVEFALQADAEAVNLSLPLLATGPYRVGAFEEHRRMELLRRRGDGPDRIVVLAFPSQEEEWRRLMNREVDLVPAASPAFAQHFQDMPSIRILPVAIPATIALRFNTRGLFADPVLRRRIAGTIDRRSLARVIVGDEAAAVETDGLERTPPHGPDERALAPPRDVRLILPDGMSELQRAAMILEQQLTPLGLRLTIDVLDLDTFVAEMRRGAFDLILLFGSYDRRYWHLLTCTSLGNVTGYCSQELDRAVLAEDEEAARRIAAQDVPLTPLYRRGEVVAMDARLCGSAPDTLIDMSWLMDVHPCREGER